MNRALLATCIAIAGSLLLRSATAAGGGFPVPAAATHGLEAYAEPGQLLTLPDGRRLNMRCTGRGAPAIILTAGAGEQSLTWHAIQAGLSARALVCAWDRPGFGFSDPSPAAQDVTHLTDDLEYALAAAGIAPPYVLVGHSLGSFETLLFTFRHPRAVTGLVLIDPAGPYQGDRLRAAAPAAYAVVDASQTAAVANLQNCIAFLEQPSKHETSDFRDDCLTGPQAAYPAVLNRALARIDRSIGGKKDMLSLLKNMFSDTDARELMQAWQPLGTMKLTVLTAGELQPFLTAGEAKAQAPAFQAAWSKMHDEMAHLSTRGINVRVPNAGHYIYQQRPEVVLGAIGDVLTAARRTTRSTEITAPVSRRSP